MAGEQLVTKPIASPAMADDAPQHHAGDEFEREPVPGKALKGASAFWGMYAGEHTAGTEFMIGPLFVAWARAPSTSSSACCSATSSQSDLAVPHRRDRHPPPADALLPARAHHRTKPRHALQFLQRRPVLFPRRGDGDRVRHGGGCAVRRPHPDAVVRRHLAHRILWILVCLVIGAAMTFVAARGYGFVARVGHISAPWMLLVFLACGIVMLRGWGRRICSR